MKFTVILEVEVENSSTESEARKAAYDLAATLNQAPKKRRGRKGAESVSAVASVVGIRVEAEEKYPSNDVVADYKKSPMPAPNTVDIFSSGRNTDAME